jgi:hypothetical protein
MQCCKLADPGSIVFLALGSGRGKNPDQGSGIIGSYFREPGYGSGLEKSRFWIRKEKMQIRDKYLGSAIPHHCLYDLITSFSMITIKGGI